MGFTVFYAWQLDTDKKTNRWFIHSAAEEAITTMQKNAAIEDAPGIEDGEIGDTESPANDNASEIRLDYGAKGEAGSSLIGETIMRKIRECGIFIADVTLTGAARTADDRIKRVPNANVLLELGAAIDSIGWGRIILVMNLAFGGAELLPFDLRHRAVQVSYTLNDAADENKPRIRKQLGKEIEQNIRAIWEKGFTTSGQAEQAKTHREMIQARKKEAEEERDQWETQVKNGRWPEIGNAHTVWTLSVIPAVVPEAPLSLPVIRKIAERRFKPLPFWIYQNYGHMPDVKLFGHHLTLSDGSYGPEVSEAPSITKVTDRGSLFCAENVGEGLPETGEVEISMQGHQPGIVSAFDNFVLGLRECGIKGPLFLGLSMIRAAKLVLRHDDMFRRPYGNMRRPISESLVRTDALTVEVQKFASFDDAQDFLLPALRQIWTEGGYPEACKYDEKRNVLGFEKWAI